MIKILLVFSIVFAVSGCPGKGKGGWPQSDKDTLINSCVEKAKNPALDEAKIKSYCSCYQQNLEKNYPNINDLKTVDANQIAKLAEECLPLIMK